MSGEDLALLNTVVRDISLRLLIKRGVPKYLDKKQLSNFTSCMERLCGFYADQPPTVSENGSASNQNWVVRLLLDRTETPDCVNVLFSRNHG